MACLRDLAQLIEDNPQDVFEESTGMSISDFSKIKNLVVYLELHPDKKFIVSEVKKFISLNQRRFEDLENPHQKQVQNSQTITLVKTAEKLMSWCYSKLYDPDFDDSEIVKIAGIVDLQLTTIALVSQNKPEFDGKRNPRLKKYFETSFGAPFAEFILTQKNEYYQKVLARRKAKAK